MPARTQLDNFRIVGVVDQDAPDTVLPEFAEQPGVPGIGRAVQDGAEQAGEARIGGHRFEPQSAVDRNIRVEPGECHAADAVDRRIAADCAGCSGRPAP